MVVAVGIFAEARLATVYAHITGILAGGPLVYGQAVGFVSIAVAQFSIWPRWYAGFFGQFLL